MRNKKYSVAIIGAGPAGSSCANALLLNRARNVALIDKAEFPRDKCCGDGLGPGVMNELRALDLADMFDGHTLIHCVTIFSPSGDKASGALPHIGGHEPVPTAFARIIKFGAPSLCTAEKSTNNCRNEK